MPRKALIVVVLTGCVFDTWSLPRDASPLDASPSDAASLDAPPTDDARDASPPCDRRAVRGLALGPDGFACAIRCNGEVWCWGRNESGQLGVGVRSASASPGPVRGVAGQATAIGLGFDHACAIADGLQCWGSNTFGALGDGSRDASSHPVAVQGLDAEVRSVAGGGLHTCAVSTAGDVWCWGDDSRGQLADATRSARVRPWRVPDLGDLADTVVAGQYHSCAKLRTGDVWCWGQNTFGTLADGTFVDRPSPRRVPLAAAVVDLSSADNHACVVLEGGAVWCWGYNSEGQLGDGSRVTRTAPVQVRALDGVRRVATGGDHTCAILDDGGVRCWGSNTHGQLGDGTTTRRGTPVAVVGLDGPAVAIGLGKAISCAGLEDGRVMCWGVNDYGQLGDGSYDDRATPVEVMLPR